MRHVRTVFLGVATCFKVYKWKGKAMGRFMKKILGFVFIGIGIIFILTAIYGLIQQYTRSYYDATVSDIGFLSEAESAKIVSAEDHSKRTVYNETVLADLTIDGQPQTVSIRISKMNKDDLPNVGDSIRVQKNIDGTWHENLRDDVPIGLLVLLVTGIVLLRAGVKKKNYDKYLNSEDFI